MIISIVAAKRKFESEYRAVLKRATVLGYSLPTYAQQKKHNTIVKSLKVFGIWAKLDVFYMFASNGSKEFATLNWIAPTLSQGTIVNSMTWTSNQGFKGNASSSYLNTNHDYTAATHYAQDNASRGFWVFTTDAVNSNTMSAHTSSRDTLVNRSSTAHRLNNTATITAVDFTGTGLMAVNRTSSTNLSFWKNTTNSIRSATSVAMVSDTMSVGKTSAAFAGTEVSLFYSGASLDTEHTNLYNTLNTYMSAP